MGQIRITFEQQYNEACKAYAIEFVESMLTYDCDWSVDDFIGMIDSDDELKDYVFKDIDDEDFYTYYNSHSEYDVYDKVEDYIEEYFNNNKKDERNEEVSSNR